MTETEILAEELRRQLDQKTWQSPRQTTSSQDSASDLPNGWHRRPPKEYATLDESMVDQDGAELMRRLIYEKTFPIFLYGKVGRGKSFLAAMICARYSGTCMMTRYSDFISDSMKASKDGHIGRYASNGVFCEFTEAGWWKHLEQVGLLILDEIGSGTGNEWRNEIVLKLLEVRKNKPLILTGNLEPKELFDRFDGRIQSRIIAGALVEHTGRDQRVNGLESRVLKIGSPE